MEYTLIDLWHNKLNKLFFVIKVLFLSVFRYAHTKQNRSNFFKENFPSVILKLLSCAVHG